MTSESLVLGRATVVGVYRGHGWLPFSRSLQCRMAAAVTTHLEPGPLNRVSADLHDDAITVGSFDFAESVVLAEVYSQALEAAGYRCGGRSASAPRVRRAGAVRPVSSSSCPEYAGTAAEFFSLGAPSRAATSLRRTTELREPSVGDRTSSRSTPRRRRTPTRSSSPRRPPPPAICDKLSDLRAVAGELTFGGPPECPTRPLCLAGSGRHVRPEVRHGRHPRRRRAADTHRRSHEGAVDVALLLHHRSADRRRRLVELDDDAACSRPRTSRRWCGPRSSIGAAPMSSTTIDAVSARLTTAALRELNGAAAERRQPTSLPSPSAWWSTQVGVMTTTPSRIRSSNRRCPRRRQRSARAADRAPDSARSRRPSGAPPPLPRKHRASGRGWLVVVVVLVVWMIVTLVSPRHATRHRPGRRRDPARPRRLRTDWLTTRRPWRSTASRPAGRCSSSPIGAARRDRWSSGAGATCSRSSAASSCSRSLGQLLIDALHAGRVPTTSRSSAAGRATRCRRRPSAVVSFTVVGIIYTLVVPGRPRDDRQGRRRRAPSRSSRAAALYLGVDHPFDVLVGVALGVAIPLNAFRFFTPNEVVPGHVPPGQDRPPRRRRPARRGDPPSGRGPARPDGPRRQARSASPAPAARRRCGSASRATPTRTCSGSSTR